MKKKILTSTQLKEICKSITFGTLEHYFETWESKHELDEDIERWINNDLKRLANIYSFISYWEEIGYVEPTQEEQQDTE